MKPKLILALLPIVLLTSCENTNNSSNNPNSITVTDGIGRSISLDPSEIKKVICVGAGALRYYAYLEGASRLAGVEDIDCSFRRSSSSPFEGVARPYYDAYKDELSSLPTCGQGGPMHQSPELEKIVSCSPDLIISDYETAEQATRMEEASGAKVFTIKYGQNGVFDDVFSNTLITLGKVLGKEDRANELVSYIASCKADISDKTSTYSKDKKVYIGGVGNWGQKDYLSTHPNYPSFNVANIANVLEGEGLATQGVQSIEKEKFVSLGSKIDVMIIDSAGLSKTIAEYAEDNTLFDNVKAVQNGEVYLQLPYNAYYQNIEINLINTYFVAESVYPGCFGSSFNIEDKADEILEKFVGKKIYSSLKSMSGQFGGYQKISDFKAFLANGGRQ